MNVKAIFKAAVPYLVKVALALAFSAGCYFWDSHRSKVHEVQNALLWARQVAAQAEGMSLAARQKSEKDPIGWATEFLSQGIEPRKMKIAKLEVNPSGAATEDFTIGPKNETLEFHKLFQPETGLGVKITVTLPYHGFLGAKSRLANDFLMVWFFAVTLALMYFIPAFFRTPPGIDKKMRKQVTEWLKDAKNLLTQLSVNIREMVREAQNLAVSAAKSRNTLEGLRSSIHTGIRGVHEGRQALREIEHSTIQAEVTALNLVLEASRLGGDGHHLGSLAEDLHKIVQKIRTLHQKGQSTMKRLEVQMEPWSTDADQAYHSYDDVFRAAEGMDGHIKRTTQALLSQAKMVQTLNTDLARDPEDDLPVAGAAAAAQPVKAGATKAVASAAAVAEAAKKKAPPKKLKAPTKKNNSDVPLDFDEAPAKAPAKGVAA